MTPEEFRESRRQNVTIPNGMAFEIRRLGALDLISMGGSFDLRPLIGKTKQEVLKAVGKRAEDLFKSVLADFLKERGFLEKIVMAGIVSPKVVSEPNIQGTICIGDLTHEELDMLAGGILNFSFLTKQEAQRIDPLSETANSSITSMQSQGDTESSQAKSSQSPGNGNPPPTPSTSHVPAQESRKKLPPAPE
jgi:hypothetical protein